MRRILAALLAGAVTMAMANGAAAGAEGQRGLASGVNAFAVGLYGRIAPADESSVFFSPYSVEMALLMARQGARGATADEMQKVLGVSGGEEAGALMKRLNGGGGERGFALSVANALWVEQTFEILPSYTDALKQFGVGGAFPEDFVGDAEGSRKQINEWVSDHTQKKIQDLMPPRSVDARTRLVLTNAVYFKASWQKPFEKNATTEQPFFMQGGKQEKLPLMHEGHLHAQYAADEEVQVLSLPYRMDAPAAGDAGPAPRMSMLVILPVKKDGLAAVEKTLTAEKLDGWTGSLKGQMVDVYLPRFKTTSTLTLNDALKGMGMEKAFGAEADFSGMAKIDRPEDRLRITDVAHKAYVSVDEEGTEAAAATGVVVGAMAMPMGQPAVFRADHPFLYLIREEASGVVVFMGRMGG
jgi:serpin B